MFKSAFLLLVFAYFHLCYIMWSQ